MSETKTETVTITSTVDPDWIEFCTAGNTNLFRGTYCGSWLFGVAHDDALGWLVFEHGDRSSINYDALPQEREAVAAWREGKPLPGGWYRLDLAAAKKGWEEGVRWRGEKWYDEGDAPRYDYVIQMALLGEERYG